MRSELHEPGHGMLTSASQSMRGQAITTLHASVVDAAHSDEVTPMTLTAGARRDMPATAGIDVSHVSIDGAHPGNAMAPSQASDGGLLRQLSRQLEMLEIQQQQIRRLLEQTEQRSPLSATRSAR